MLLFFLSCWVVNCSTDQQLADSQNLAKVGSKSAASMAAYYESLADMVSRQPELEIFYQAINPALPKLAQTDFDLLDQQRAALQRRTQLARDLQGFYEALQKLTAYKTGENVGKAVDNLTNSLTLITNEPPRLFGVDLSVTLTPVISSIVGWKQSRDSKQAIVAMQITLNGLERLVNSEKDIYNRIILDRYFTLLNGNVNGGTKGIASYLLTSQSVTIDFLLQQLPELQALPWSTGPVQDAVIKTAMQRVLANHLSALETKAKGTAQNVADSLQELTIEHQKLLDGRPLTLATVLGYQGQVQDYIDLWRKFRPKK
ncbi:MAG: hypothetical protein H7Z72_10000 [Bacteroidetes bacterium]|nr:hypothetical protein [Fibrella sp.]